MIAAYIRVSTYEQNLDLQRAEIGRWLKLHGHESVRWYEDKETAKHLQRPGFEQLQKTIFAGDVTTVVVWKIDRLSRRLRDGINVVSDWIDQDVRLISVTQQIDLSGAMGKAMLAILFAFAEMELETSKERQAAGIAVAKANGKYKGRKPGTHKGSPSRARALKAKGLNEAEIAAALNVTERTVFRYLRHTQA